MLIFSILTLLIAAALLIGHFGIPEQEPPFPSKRDPTKIMPGAEPYFLQGQSDTAFLICHGFGDSAFNTRPLGEFFHSLGHTAIGLLLPGHGTDVKDMAETRYNHYLAYLRHVYLKERPNYKRLFIVGFSMGGTLSLDLASRIRDHRKPTGLIVVSSPVFFNGFFNGRLILHQPLMMLTGILQEFISVLKIDRKISIEADEINPWLGYRFQYPLRTLHSFKRVMPDLRRRLPNIEIPAALIMSYGDSTVSPENHYYIYSRIHSIEKRACMFDLPEDGTTRHVLPTHRDAVSHWQRFLEQFIDDTIDDTGGPFWQKKSIIERIRSYFSF